MRFAASPTTRRAGLRFPRLDRRSERDALLDPRPELGIGSGDEGTEGLPDLERLQNAERFAPLGKAVCENHPLPLQRQDIARLAQEGPARHHDAGIALRHRIGPNDHLAHPRRSPAARQQDPADAPQDTRPVRKPPARIERRRHRHRAGHIDASVARPDAPDAIVGCRNPDRARRIAAQRQIASPRPARGRRSARRSARHPPRRPQVGGHAVVRVVAHH